MSVSVKEIRDGMGMPDQVSCLFRGDEKIITPCEARASCAGFSALYVLQQLTQIIPSSILEGQVFLISTGVSGAAGIIAGLSLGVLSKISAPKKSYLDEWKYWALSLVAERPSVSALLITLQVSGSVGNVLGTIYLHPKSFSIINGAAVGFAAGYNAGRITVEAVGCAVTAEKSREATPLI